MGTTEKEKMQGKVFVTMLGLVVAIAGYGVVFGEEPLPGPRIARITHSKDAIVKYPSISNDGFNLLYYAETRDPSDLQEKTGAIKIITTDGAEERALFVDNTLRAPAPYNEFYLVCGTRPPQLSGDGSTAVFSLSVLDPISLEDHYVGITNTDGSGFRVLEIKNKALTMQDWTEKGFKDDTWERISNYAVSNDGKRLVLVVKGHRGPRKFGFPSAIVAMLSDGSDQRTLIAPEFEKDGWVWSSFPRKPYTEGGWAFDFSGNGEKVLFGAQSSPDTDDYDLYISDWKEGGLKKITDFQDRYFTMADLSDDGERVVFFYSGKKKSGIGTYAANADGSGLTYVQAKAGGWFVLYEDVDATGHMIVARHKYFGFVVNLDRNEEKVVLNPSVPGYVSANESFMDFPYFPSFWNPNIMARNALVVTGIPEGRMTREFYLLEYTFSGDE